MGMDTNERRAYQRSALHCDAKVSADGRDWTPFEVRDLSSSGLRMELEADYEPGVKLFFDIVLYGLSTQFDVKVTGLVRRKHHAGHYYVYGVAFTGVTPDLRIRIDETINHMRPRDFLL
jgi:hypothetical protein